MFGKSERSQDYQRTKQPIVALAKNYSDGFCSKWHYHRRGQLIFAARGVIAVSTRAGRWTIPATRAVWIPPHIAHSNRMYGEVHLRTVYVEPKSHWHLPTECTVVSVSPLLRELILQAVEIKNDYATGGRDSRLMRLLVDEMERLEAGSFYLRMPTDPRALRVARGILTDLSSPWSQSKWARHVKTSSRTLARLFTNELGISFGHWRQEARLQASLLLLAQGKGILEIALQLGYASPSAFSAAFRKYFGTTPSMYFAR